MLGNDYQMEQQKRIIEFLKVAPHFEVEQEITKRINFIKKQMLLSRRKTLVLGISGGVDSTVTGRLAQLAVESLRQENVDAHFIAIRLPYGIQQDEEEAQQAVAFIKPDELLTINIKAACDQTLSSLLDGNLKFIDHKQQDFILGNIKARQRMVVQYAVAGTRDGLVLGTDQAAEALMGFFTKYGDGACDLAPLEGLNKRRVRAIGQFLNAPMHLVNKKPTADLETLSPQLPDEQVFGLSYDQIDDFLEGKKMDEQVYKIIFAAYDATAHKRALPYTPS